MSKELKEYELHNLVKKIRSMCFTHDCIPKKPGALINSLSEKDRELCKKLKASHFNCPRDARYL